MAVTEPRPLIFRPSPCAARWRCAAGRKWIEKTTRMRHRHDETGRLGVSRGHSVTLRGPCVPDRSRIPATATFVALSIEPSNLPTIYSVPARSTSSRPLNLPPSRSPYRPAAGLHRLSSWYRPAAGLHRLSSWDGWPSISWVAKMPSYGASYGCSPLSRLVAVPSSNFRRSSFVMFLGMPITVPSTRIACTMGWRELSFPLPNGESPFQRSSQEGLAVRRTERHNRLTQRPVRRRSPARTLSLHRSPNRRPADGRASSRT